MIIRRNQKDLTATEWTRFVTAFKNVTKGFLQNTAKPTLDDFADEHAKAFTTRFMHEWGVHSHFVKGVLEHRGLFFLSWHRVFLHEFEQRLRREDSTVVLPYWNAAADALPDEIKTVSANEGRTIPRAAGPDVPGLSLPSFSEPDFESFQLDLEVAYHNPVHALLKGRMDGRHSPKDAAFWMHHAFVDRQWGHWYEKHNGTLPSTMSDRILGDEIVTGAGKYVRDVAHTTQLGFVYDNGIVANDARNGGTSRVQLRRGQILTVKLPTGDLYAKILVYSLSAAAATLVIKLYPQCLPGDKLIMIIPETMFYRLDTSKIRVPAAEGHLSFTVAQDESGARTYSVAPVNRVRLSEFTELTDFTANDPAGSTDFQMLAI